MTVCRTDIHPVPGVSTHMPLARHDKNNNVLSRITVPFLLTCLLRGMTHVSRHRRR